jgi:hypothetical protein
MEIYLGQVKSHTSHLNIYFVTVSAYYKGNTNPTNCSGSKLLRDCHSWNFQWGVLNFSLRTTSSNYNNNNNNNLSGNSAYLEEDINVLLNYFHRLFYRAVETRFDPGSWTGGPVSWCENCYYNICRYFCILVRTAASANFISLTYHEASRYFGHCFQLVVKVSINGSELWSRHLVRGSSVISSTVLNPRAGWMLAHLKAGTPLSKSGISQNHVAHMQYGMRS